MNIHTSQLFWYEQKGTCPATSVWIHSHLGRSRSMVRCAQKSLDSIVFPFRPGPGDFFLQKNSMKGRPWQLRLNQDLTQLKVINLGLGWSWMVDGLGVSVFSLGAVPYLDIMVPNLWRWLPGLYSLSHPKNIRKYSFVSAATIPMIFIWIIPILSMMFPIYGQVPHVFSIDFCHRNPKFGSVPSRWCPPVISWFIIPLTIDISPINHSYWSYKPT
jgi:hypothetical protein